jgi:hypothetical protein
VAIVVLDASVAIAFLDATDPHHSGAVAALTRLQGSDMVLPASAYAAMLAPCPPRAAVTIRGMDQHQDLISSSPRGSAVLVPGARVVELLVVLAQQVPAIVIAVRRAHHRVDMRA